MLHPPYGGLYLILNQWGVEGNHCLPKLFCQPFCHSNNKTGNIGNEVKTEEWFPLFAVTYFSECLYTVKLIGQVMVRAQFSSQNLACGKYLMNSTLSFVAIVFISFIIWCHTFVFLFPTLDHFIRISFSVPYHGLTHKDKLKGKKKKKCIHGCLRHQA